jgi:hypothetical protein
LKDLDDFFIKIPTEKKVIRPMTDFTATSCSCRSTAVLEPSDRLDSEHRDVADEKSLCSRCLIGSIEMPSRYSREEIKFYRDVALAPIYPSQKRHRADDLFYRDVALVPIYGCPGAK